MWAADQDGKGSKFLMRRSSSPSSSMGKRGRKRVHIRRSGRRSWSRIEKRVRMLKRLVPNIDQRRVGLEGLFVDTADYILSLEARVRTMQIMVDRLSAVGDEGEVDLTVASKAALSKEFGEYIKS
ncbi:hypothetical protein SAY87_003372 [Trapa incisa]|uniref:BHLH domain-containing protein n=1 Tax=Trapa incisa TaxID=236973 RepID=A0AAN7KR57_9MYRT|nr:hypothetical protein SAY87_003372 [Trapa incisa]